MAKSHVTHCAGEHATPFAIMTRVKQGTPAYCRSHAAQRREGATVAATFAAVRHSDPVVARAAAQSDAHTLAALIERIAPMLIPSAVNGIDAGMLDRAALDSLAIVEYVGSLADRASHGQDPASLIASRDAVSQAYRGLSALLSSKHPARRTEAYRVLREALA